MTAVKNTLAAATAALLILAACGGSANKARESGIPEAEAAIGKSSNAEPGASAGNDIPEPDAIPDTDAIPDADGFITDARDGKRYRTVKIGEQRWMAENLNYETDGSCCHGHNDANCATFGRLYTWDAAMTVCPAGWHLPARQEWRDMVSAVGDSAGTKLQSKPNEDGTTETPVRGFSPFPRGRLVGGGTDEFGFSAMLGGFVRNDEKSGQNWWSAVADSTMERRGSEWVLTIRTITDGIFSSLGAYWWSATEDGAGNAWGNTISADNNSYDVYEKRYDKNFGFSVRCVREEDR